MEVSTCAMWITYQVRTRYLIHKGGRHLVRHAGIFICVPGTYLVPYTQGGHGTERGVQGFICALTQVYACVILRAPCSFFSQSNREVRQNDSSGNKRARTYS